VITSDDELSTDTSDKDETDNQDPPQETLEGEDQVRENTEQEAVSPRAGEDPTSDHKEEGEVSESPAPGTPSDNEDDEEDEDYRTPERETGKSEENDAEQGKGVRDHSLHQFFEPLPNQAEETDDKPTPDPPTQEGDESQGPADNTERKVQEGPTQQ